MEAFRKAVTINVIDHEEIGLFIRKERKKHEIRLKDFAKAMGIGSMELSRLETGNIPWNQVVFDKACSLLGIDPPKAKEAADESNVQG